MTATSTTSSATKKSTKNALVPRLRFPEFEGSGEWERTTIEKSCDLLNNHRAPIRASNRISGPIPYYGASGIVDYIDDYIFDDELLLVGEDGAKWGAFENTAFIVRGKCWVNNHAHVLKPHLLNILFLEAYLIKIDLFPYVTGAAPPKLTLTQLKSITIPLPSLPEQQKIADCLSSLDDLITAESAKLEALKEHKKGLMQELFPREGETTPRLRFPEFEGSGEWEVKRLGELLAKKPDYGVNAPAVSFSPDLPAYIRITDILDEGKLSNNLTSVNVTLTDQNILRDGDIVVARTGASVGKSYQYRPQDGTLVFAGFLIRLAPQSHLLDTTYLANYMTSNQYWLWVSIMSVRSGQPGLNAEEYSSFPIPVPPYFREQQKIAFVLSSLDDRITAQTQQIETLQAYKKGLMQQLFPVIEK